jgi:transposase
LIDQTGSSWTQRFGLTDAEWERLAPLLPSFGGRDGRWADHRQVVSGILYRVRTGVPRRDLPERFGSWKTAHERHRRWSADGTWQQILTELRIEADVQEGQDWTIGIDSTSVRADQHAACGVPLTLSRCLTCDATVAWWRSC